MINSYIGSNWYQRVATDIEMYQTRLGDKEAKKYKLDMLMRIARRVGEFQQTCGECEDDVQVINNLVNEMAMQVQIPSKQGMKSHVKAVDVMVEHMKKGHGLVDKGHYLGMGIGIGLAIGAGIGGALGAALDNPGIGTGFGIAIGVAIGTFLDRRAKQEGRVI